MTVLALSWAYSLALPAWIALLVVVYSQGRPVISSARRRAAERRRRSLSELQRLCELATSIESQEDRLVVLDRAFQGALLDGAIDLKKKDLTDAFSRFPGWVGPAFPAVVAVGDSRDGSEREAVVSNFASDVFTELAGDGDTPNAARIGRPGVQLAHVRDDRLASIDQVSERFRSTLAEIGAAESQVDERLFYAALVQVLATLGVGDRLTVRSETLERLRRFADVPGGTEESDLNSTSSNI